MENGLRQKLNDWIRQENGRIVSINEIEAQVKIWGYKISNYERRLRPSESPNIERIKKNGAIIGYKYLEPGPDVVEWFKSKPRTSKQPLFNLNGQLLTEYKKQNAPANIST